MMYGFLKKGETESHIKYTTKKTLAAATTTKLQNYLSGIRQIQLLNLFSSNDKILDFLYFYIVKYGGSSNNIAHNIQMPTQMQTWIIILVSKSIIYLYFFIRFLLSNHRLHLTWLKLLHFFIQGFIAKLNYWIVEILSFQHSKSIPCTWKLVTQFGSIRFIISSHCSFANFTFLPNSREHALPSGNALSNWIILYMVPILKLNKPSMVERMVCGNSFHWILLEHLLHKVNSGMRYFTA